MAGRVVSADSRPLPPEWSAYAGRWVAILQQRVIAQGGTPQQARRAAQSRFKETPDILYIPMNPPLILPPFLDTVRLALPADCPLYLVGGAIRDLLLGRAVHDFDFALPAEAIPAARRVADALNAAFYPLDPERDTGRVITRNEAGEPVFLDFAAFRGADIDADLEGRDFTINAMAMDLRSQTFLDPLGGMADLREKRLRACSPSAFTDDAIRIVRGVRLAAALGFHILPETRAAMKVAAEALARVSAERLRDELFRLFETPRIAASLRALDLLGALRYLLPELLALKDVPQPEPHLHDVWTHTLATVDHLQAILTVLAGEKSGRGADWFHGLLALRLGRYRQALNAHLEALYAGGRSHRGLLFLAALYHDIAKPATAAMEEGRLRFVGHDAAGVALSAARGRALALSNEEIDNLKTMVAQHMRVHFHVNRRLREGQMPSRRAIYRFFRDTGAVGVEICLLTLADLRATFEHTLPQETWAAALEVVCLLLENWFEKPAESIAPPPLLNGHDLIQALELPPGPRVGELLEAIREAQAVGEVSTREEALALARARLNAKP